jgi:hypothetical protein
MTTFKLENRKKPTPKFWVRVGKGLVAAMGVVTASVAMVPLPIWPKLGIIVGANGLLYLGKWLTTLTAEEEIKK